MALIRSLERAEIDQSVSDIYQSFKERSGSVPEWVKIMAHRPKILQNFYGLFNTVMRGGLIDGQLKWKIGYVVSQTLKCDFCVDVTSKMLVKLDAKKEELEKIKNIEDDPEKETLALVKDVTMDGYLDNPDLLEDLKNKFNEAEMVEIISVIGLFNYINRFNNTFAILPK